MPAPEEKGPPKEGRFGTDTCVKARQNIYSAFAPQKIFGRIMQLYAAIAGIPGDGGWEKRLLYQNLTDTIWETPGSCMVMT